MLNYLFSVHPGFGPLSWLSMLGWLIALGIGAYLYTVWQERNPVRARFLHRFGLGSSILGAVGILLLALKAFRLPYVSWPVWSYLAAVATLAFMGWAAWFYLQRLPRLLVASGRVGAKGTRGARTYSSNGTPSVQARVPQPPRPVASTGRREARRDKKRKSR